MLCASFARRSNTCVATATRFSDEARARVTTTPTPHKRFTRGGPPIQRQQHQTAAALGANGSISLATKFQCVSAGCCVRSCPPPNNESARHGATDHSRVVASSSCGLFYARVRVRVPVALVEISQCDSDEYQAPSCSVRYKRQGESVGRSVNTRASVVFLCVERCVSK